MRSLSLQAFGRVVVATCKARNVCPAHSETDFRNSLIEAGVRLRRCSGVPGEDSIVLVGLFLIICADWRHLIRVGAEIDPLT